MDELEKFYKQLDAAFMEKFHNCKCKDAHMWLLAARLIQEEYKKYKKK